MTTTATVLSGMIAGPKATSSTAAIATDFMADTDIELIEATSAGVVRVLVAGVDYDFTLDGTAPSEGTLEFLYDLASGDTVYWRRVTTLDQQTDLTALSSFPADAIERTFDKAILALQESSEVSVSRTRSFTFSSGWSAFLTANTRYYKHNGLVYLEGAVTKTGTINAEQMVSVPAGFRPPTGATRIYRCTVVSGGVYSTEQVSIQSTGAITKLEATAVVNPVIYLDGIVYRPA